MTRLAYTLFGTSLFIILSASAASGQAQRTFVARTGIGNDSNPCTLQAPCRTFTQAISQTSPGGEVVVLNSAGYGAVSITKAISLISPPGVYAGISVFSGDGIDINAGASDVVTLRGLTINNQGTFGSGIAFNGGGTLHVENCVTNGFTAGFGISFNAAGILSVKDSIARGNFSGIVVQPAAGAALADLEGVRLEGNAAAGLVAGGGAGTTKVTVRNSFAAGNNTGFATVPGNGPIELNIESCISSNNSSGGIAAFANNGETVIVRVSSSTVTNNNIGLSASNPAVLLSRVNNTVEGNGTNTIGIGSYTSK
jgi:hypothetical protein